MLRALAPFAATLLVPSLAFAQPDGSGDDADALLAGTEALGTTMDALLVERAPWLLTEVLGIALWRFVAALLTVALVIAIRRALLNVVMRKLRQWTSRTKTRVDDQLIEAADPPLGWFIAAFGVYAATLWLQLPDGVQDVLQVMYRVVCVVIIAWAMLRVSTLLTWLLQQMAAHTDSSLDDHLVPLVGRVARVAVVALAVVFVFQELGFNVAGLIAGLGVGGIALALAAQDTVANWFGALMIYTDRPFEIGDWIKTGEMEGVVEEIGLRSTKIRTFSKTVISVPNADLAGDTIENFSRMPIRRIYVNVGVTYATTPSMMPEALERLRDILRTHPGVDQTFWLVKFNDFGDSALNIMLYFFSTTTNWEEYLSIREDIFLQIMSTLDEIGVGFAFPSTSVYLEKPDPDEIQQLDQRARRLYEARVRVDDAHEAMTAPSDITEG